MVADHLAMQGCRASAARIVQNISVHDQKWYYELELAQTPSNSGDISTLHSQFCPFMVKTLTHWPLGDLKNFR